MLSSLERYTYIAEHPHKKCRQLKTELSLARDDSFQALLAYVLEVSFVVNCIGKHPAST